MDKTIPEKLQTYIDAELGDALTYRKLAEMATDKDDKQIILKFAQDEQAHARRFIDIYKKFTGRIYSPDISLPEFAGDYREMLLDRVIDESGDFRKYSEQYLTSTVNRELRDAYYMAATDENVHALRLLYLINRIKQF